MLRRVFALYVRDNSRATCQRDIPRSQLRRAPAPHVKEFSRSMLEITLAPYAREISHALKFPTKLFHQILPKSTCKTRFRQIFQLVKQGLTVDKRKTADIAYEKCVGVTVYFQTRNFLFFLYFCIIFRFYVICGRFWFHLSRITVCSSLLVCA